MRKNLSHLVGYLAHRDLGDMENLSYFQCLYDQKGWLAHRNHASQRRDLGKRDEQKSI